MYKWNMGNDIVEMIDDPELSAKRNEDDWNPEISPELVAEFEELENVTLVEEIFNAPKTAVLQLQVSKYSDY